VKQYYKIGMILPLFIAIAGCGMTEEPTNAEKVASAEDIVSEASADVKPEAKTAELTGEEKLVVAFGDSLYAGYRLEPGEGFVPELQKSLRKAGINAKVHSAGVSGDTSAAGLRRFDFVLDSLKRKPDLVVIGLGGNDMLRGIKPEETTKNMEAMLQNLKKRGINSMLSGMLAAPNLGEEYSSKFNPLFPRLAKKYDAAFYPFFMDGVVGDTSLILSDGIHPNAEGIDIIVGKIAPVVIEALDK